MADGQSPGAAGTCWAGHRAEGEQPRGAEEGRIGQLQTQGEPWGVGARLLLLGPLRVCPPACLCPAASQGGAVARWDEVHLPSDHQVGAMPTMGSAERGHSQLSQPCMSSPSAQLRAPNPAAHLGRRMCQGVSSGLGQASQLSWCSKDSCSFSNKTLFAPMGLRPGSPLSGTLQPWILHRATLAPYLSQKHNGQGLGLDSSGGTLLPSRLW